MSTLTRVEARLDTLIWMTGALITVVLMNLAGTLAVLARLTRS
jgi:hypothetical protein